MHITAKTANKQVALVTGASSSMSRAFARALRAFGMTVYAAALGAVALHMDINRQDKVQEAVQGTSAWLV